jgi:broad-specificity NMP kinase
MDPTSVKPGDYCDILAHHTALCEKLKKKGWPNAKVNDQETVESEMDEESAAGASEKAPVGLDSDIFA